MAEEEKKKKRGRKKKRRPRNQIPKGLLEEYPHATNDYLSKKYKVNVFTIKSWAHRFHIRKSKEFVSHQRSTGRKRTLLSKEDLERFLSLAPTHTNEQLAEMFGITPIQACGLRKGHGAPMSQELRLQVKRAGVQKWKERRERRIRLGLETPFNPHLFWHTQYLLRRGYIIDKDYRIAYWDRKTQRGAVVERRKRYYNFMEWTPEIARKYED
jgi:hypothetical protein